MMMRTVRRGGAWDARRREEDARGTSLRGMVGYGVCVWGFDWMDGVARVDAVMVHVIHPASHILSLHFYLSNRTSQ